MENSIIIKNLPKGFYVAELCDNFRCCGNIVSATIYCDNNQSVGEAYIEFNDRLSALSAVKFMNNRRVKNRLIQVSLSTENSHFKKVFVKNFSPSWDVCDLLKAFENVGSVENVRISEENGKSNCYGFVEFSNHYTAKRAIECMNGKKIDGQELIVERFKSKSERESLVQNSLEHVQKMLQKSIQHNNLYVKNLPVDMKEDHLKKLFEKFGNTTSVKIAVDENGISRQFGFVCFENIQDAEKALKRMNGYCLRGKQLHVSLKEDGQLRKQLNSLKNKEKDVKIKEYKQRSQSVPKLLPYSLNHRGASNAF